MSKPNLWDLSDAELELFEALAVALDDAENAQTSDEQLAAQAAANALLNDYLLVQEGLQQKMDAYAGVILALDRRARHRAEQSAKWLTRANQDKNAVIRMKDRLKDVLRQRGVPVMETANHVIRIQNNGGIAPIEVPAKWEKEPASAPEQFHRKRIELDKEAIRAALIEGEEVEGCAILPRGSHVRIS